MDNPLKGYRRTDMLMVYTKGRGGITTRKVGPVAILVILITGAAISGCLPGVRGEQDPVVILTYQKMAHRLAILLRDMKLKVFVRAPDPVPYSANASAGVWVGVRFPADRAVAAILLARRYYHDLRYVALSDKMADPPDSVHDQLFIGGSTETALRQCLKAWNDDDFKKMEGVKNQTELHALIRSKYSTCDPKIMGLSLL